MTWKYGQVQPIPRKVCNLLAKNDIVGEDESVDVMLNSRGTNEDEKKYNRQIINGVDLYAWSKTHCEYLTVDNFICSLFQLTY